MRRRPPDSVLSVAVRAFQDATAIGGDAAATRTRVLAAGARASHARLGPRRFTLPIAGVVLVMGTTALATVMTARWRAPAPLLVKDATPDIAAAVPLRASVVIPSATFPPPDRARAGETLDGETLAYGRAHRAHFVENRPAAALAAWDAYLRRYPRGTFVPEARFNRALCLARLGRAAEARQALQPFADGRYGAYRREDADRLLDWLPRAAPGAARGPRTR